MWFAAVTKVSAAGCFQALQSPGKPCFKLFEKAAWILVPTCQGRPTAPDSSADCLASGNFPHLNSPSLLRVSCIFHFSRHTANMMSCNFKNLVERLYLTELISLKSHIGGFYSFGEVGELGKESAVIKNKGLGVKQARVWSSCAPLPLTTCVTLSKLLTKPQFPHLQNRDDVSHLRIRRHNSCRAYERAKVGTIAGVVAPGS